MVLLFLHTSSTVFPSLEVSSKPGLLSRRRCLTDLLRGVIFPLIILFLSFITACQTNPQSLVKPDTLVALRVDQVPLEGDDETWQKAPKLVVETKEVKLQDPQNGPAITLQATYDSRDLSIRIEWNDATQNIYMNAWTWDGVSFFKTGEEDRVIFQFPIENDPDFSSKGCAAVCHNQESNPEKWYMAANAASFRYDQWHWKATRTNPVRQADDKWLGMRANPSDTESAHYGDKIESGGEKLNRNHDRNGPEYMNGKDLESPYIFAGQEVPLDVSLLQPGDIIPGYILSPMKGSRGDISASGNWEDGRWVVVLVRSLNTGHDDDVIFIPPKPIPFGVAIMENSGGYDHFVSEKVLTLVWR